MNDQQDELEKEIGKIQGVQHPAAPVMAVVAQEVKQSGISIKERRADLQSLEGDLGVFDENYRRQREELVAQITAIETEIEGRNEVHHILVSTISSLDQAAKSVKKATPSKAKPVRKAVARKSPRKPRAKVVG